MESVPHHSEFTSIWTINSFKQTLKHSDFHPVQVTTGRSLTLHNCTTKPHTCRGRNVHHCQVLLSCHYYSALFPWRNWFLSAVFLRNSITLWVGNKSKRNPHFLIEWSYTAPHLKILSWILLLCSLIFLCVIWVASSFLCIRWFKQTRYHAFRERWIFHCGYPKERRSLQDFITKNEFNLFQFIYFRASRNLFHSFGLRLLIQFKQHR